MMRHNTYQKNNEGIINIYQFVERNKHFIIDILRKDNVEYCKATLLYRYLMYSNIIYTEEYITENGTDILKMMLEVFYTYNKKKDEYDDKNIHSMLKKGDATLLKMNSIDFVLNNP